MINHKIYQTAEQVVESLANDMKAFSEMGRPVHISLSGGSTPKMLF
ncbi:6-phosphogluconolactonase, partial [Vibrio parahaemolyticus]|nr:6-phosphogluconolactonase [Vibrio parahaemolyticus]MDG2688118.1 6-phosphogluconolactonase [Vibrio parahaemolyticus]